MDWPQCSARIRRDDPVLGHDPEGGLHRGARPFQQVLFPDLRPSHYEQRRAPQGGSPPSHQSRSLAGFNPYFSSEVAKRRFWHTSPSSQLHQWSSSPAHTSLLRALEERGAKPGFDGFSPQSSSGMSGSAAARLQLQIPGIGVIAIVVGAPMSIPSDHEPQPTSDRRSGSPPEPRSSPASTAVIRARSCRQPFPNHCQQYRPGTRCMSRRSAGGSLSRYGAISGACSR